ncbi:MAG: iron chelate uptake ABC transporter family permease subunit, partial [Alphaproteobacteria bacterium]
MTVIAETAAQGEGKAARRPGVAASNAWRLTGLLICLAVLLVTVLASIAVGSRDIPLPTVIDALLAYDDSNDHAIVQTLRLPRTVLGLLVGAALGISGALIQALTRNPLAD